MLVQTRKTKAVALQHQAQFLSLVCIEEDCTSLRLWWQPEVHQVYSVHNGMLPSVISVGDRVPCVLPKISPWCVAAHVGEVANRVDPMVVL